MRKRERDRESNFASVLAITLEGGLEIIFFFLRVEVLFGFGGKKKRVQKNKVIRSVANNV